MSRLLRMMFALGMIGFAAGLGMLIDGSTSPGIRLLVGSILLAAVPTVVFVRYMRELRTYRLAAGAEVRSAVADDPAFAGKFRSHGLLIVCLSTPLFLAAGATLVAISRSASENLSTGGTVTGVLLGAIFAGIPALLGGRLLANGLRLLRGVVYGAQVAILMLRIILILAAIAILLALAELSHPNSPALLRAAIPTVIACLIVSGLLQRFVGAVRAAEAAASRGTGAPPGLASWASEAFGSPRPEATKQPPLAP